MLVVPGWVNVAAGGAMCGMAGLAAMLPAVRASLVGAAGPAVYQLTHPSADSRALPVGSLPGQVPVTAFDGNAARTGYLVIAGHWYVRPAQADVSTAFLTATGTTVGEP